MDDKKPHCGTCRHHGFQGIENYCRKHQRIIRREKWDLEKDDRNICSCDQYDNWENKEGGHIESKQN